MWVSRSPVQPIDPVRRRARTSKWCDVYQYPTAISQFVKFGQWIPPCDALTNETLAPWRMGVTPVDQSEWNNNLNSERGRGSRSSEGGSNKRGRVLEILNSGECSLLKILVERPSTLKPVTPFWNTWPHIAEKLFRVIFVALSNCTATLTSLRRGQAHSHRCLTNINYTCNESRR